MIRPIENYVEFYDAPNCILVVWYDYKRLEACHISNFRETYCVTPPCVPPFSE